MNSIISKLFATLFITAIVLSAIPAKAIIPPPSFWIDPTAVNFNTSTTNIGDTFTVTVWIGTLGASYTWQTKILFDPTQLQAIAADYTGVGKSLFFTPHATIPVVPVIDNVLGSVVHGESLVGADSVPAGSGTLFRIMFQIIAAPPPGGSLTSSIVPSANPNDTFILDPDLNSVQGISVGGCIYTYTWAPPANPTLAVSPAYEEFNQYSIWNGYVFSETIVINGLSAGWYLGNVSTHMSYNPTYLLLTGVAFDPIWDVLATYTDTGPGDLSFVARTSAVPSGNVIVATITFTIQNQPLSPPLPVGWFVDIPKTLTGDSMYSETYNFIINHGKTNGLVRLYSYQVLTPAWLSVSSASVGPGPSIGEEFNITVSINELHFAWNLIGVQFRLNYNAALVEPVAVYEGPFMPYWAARQPGSLGTFFVSFPNEPGPPDGTHVLVGGMIFPDMNGIWHPDVDGKLTEGTGVLAIITFKVLYQSFGDPDIHSSFNIIEQLAIGLDNYVDQNIVDVPLGIPINGTYTVTTDLPGRMIDVYGHAVNSGYGPLDWQQYVQFPPPYGGQGPNMPMDLVEPQSWVTLNANVTYNYWPVQHKNVAFEIQMPDGTVYNKLSAFTDVNGVATIGYRMPWPCDNPESLFGVWVVTATVQLADVIITDHLYYHYDYMVHIWKVTTDKFEYNHAETVTITFEYGSHAQQTYPVLFVISIVDELGVTIGVAYYETTVGGTVFCQYKNWEATVTIWIPKWAYAGIATVHINTFDKEPVDGGVAISPEWVGPTIAIQPY